MQEPDPPMANVKRNPESEQLDTCHPRAALRTRDWLRQESGALNSYVTLGQSLLPASVSPLETAGHGRESGTRVSIDYQCHS